MRNQADRLVATYSIVARDPRSGDFGVAVQSNYFSVGTQAPWAEAGLGAIATQSIVEVAYGPRGLKLLSEGQSAKNALDQLLSEDPGAALRQVAIVDGAGSAAAHTGPACVRSCGHATGDGYSVQGNMLESDAVWQAMGPAYESAEGDLAERLMTALEAAEAGGGDVRGRQSAALIVVSGEPQENSWEGRYVDLHVEDDPRPLEELRRLLSISKAYALFEDARTIMGTGDIDRALTVVEQALVLRPEDPQFTFWTGVAFANAGRDEEARHWLERSFRCGDGWRELGLRLLEAGFYSGSPALLNK
jgi:uncharacterized Ntn-hydrolase superfamily protein